MNAAEIQVCRTCGETKPLDQFWKQRVSKSGYQTECKPCMRSRNTSWHRRHSEDTGEKSSGKVAKSRREYPLKQMMRSMRHRAKKRGLEFSITAEDLLPVPDVCPVLGIKLAWNVGWGRGQAAEVRDHTPSLDRIDNSRGYVPGNVAVVSWRANRLKSDATLEELKMMVAFYENVSGGHLPGVGPEAGQHGTRALLHDMPQVQPFAEAAQPPAQMPRHYD